MATDAEWNMYADAINKLQKSGIWYTYARVHKLMMDPKSAAHRTSQFWPWHREFLRAMEVEIKMTAPESEREALTIIYWDWTSTERTKKDAIVFKRMGGNTHDSETGCINTGSFAHFDTTVSPCIKRGATFKQVLNDAAEMTGKINAGPSTSRDPKAGYDYARKIVEYYHDTVHVAIAGQMTTGQAPNDPLFYAHHAFIDMIWQQWQDISPENKLAYDGAMTEKLEFFGDKMDEVEGLEKTNMYGNNDFHDVDVADTMKFQAIKNPGLDSLLLQVSSEGSIDGDHPMFAEESQEVKDLASNIMGMVHETSAVHVAKHNQAQLAKHAAKHVGAEAGSEAAVLLEAATKAVAESDGDVLTVHEDKVYNTIEYDGETYECDHEQCLTSHDVTVVVKKVGIEHIPRMCKETERIIKGGEFDIWWSEEVDVVYAEQVARHKLAEDEYGVEEVANYTGGCLAIPNIIKDVEKIEAAEKASE